LVSFGRMKPGTTFKSARADMDNVGRTLQADYPATNKGVLPWVRTFNDVFVGTRNNVLNVAMIVAVTFVLLIACANVANLQLSRAVRRSREISIRIALGAGRWPIIRQLLVESLLLSVAGAFVAWLFAIEATHFFDVVITARNVRPEWLDF